MRDLKGVAEKCFSAQPASSEQARIDAERAEKDRAITIKINKAIARWTRAYVIITAIPMAIGGASVWFQAHTPAPTFHPDRFRGPFHDRELPRHDGTSMASFKGSQDGVMGTITRFLRSKK